MARFAFLAPYRFQFFKLAKQEWIKGSWEQLPRLSWCNGTLPLYSYQATAHCNTSASTTAATSSNSNSSSSRSSNSSSKGSSNSSSRIYEDDEHTIRDHQILEPVWRCLLTLRSAGHEAYLVGGTVRDLLLGRAPKDYDLLTSASLTQVRDLFTHAVIVGRNFPICHVHIDGLLVEISSIQPVPSQSAPRSFTSSRNSIGPFKLQLHNSSSKGAGGPRDAATKKKQLSERRISSSRPDQLEQRQSSFQQQQQQPAGEVVTWSQARRANARSRDFTVNALLYDPFTLLLYDYVGGVADLQRGLVRCVRGNAAGSFQQDPARMLRAIRCASRTGMQLDVTLSSTVQSSRGLLLHLPPERLRHELQALLRHGAAAAAFALMEQLGLLEVLLPVHQDYLKAWKNCNGSDIGSDTAVESSSCDNNHSSSTSCTPAASNWTGSTSSSNRYRKDGGSSSVCSSSSSRSSSSSFIGSPLHGVLLALDRHASPPLPPASPEVLLAVLVAPLLAGKLRAALAAAGALGQAKSTTVQTDPDQQQRWEQQQQEQQQKEQVQELQQKVHGKSVRGNPACQRNQQQQQEALVEAFWKHAASLQRGVGEQAWEKTKGKRSRSSSGCRSIHTVNLGSGNSRGSSSSSKNGSSNYRSSSSSSGSSSFPELGPMRLKQGMGASAEHVLMSLALTCIEEVITSPARSPSGEFYPNHRVLAQSTPELAAGLLLCSWRLSKQQQQGEKQQQQQERQQQQEQYNHPQQRAQLGLESCRKGGLHGVASAAAADGAGGADTPPATAAAAVDAADMLQATPATAAAAALATEGVEGVSDTGVVLGRKGKKLKGPASGSYQQKQGVRLALEKVHEQLLAMGGAYGSNSSSSSSRSSSSRDGRSSSSGSRYERDGTMQHSGHKGSSPRGSSTSRQGWGYAEEWCMPKTNKQYRKWNLRGLHRGDEQQEQHQHGEVGGGAVRGKSHLHQQQQQQPEWQSSERMGSLFTVPRQLLQEVVKADGEQWDADTRQGGDRGIQHVRPSWEDRDEAVDGRRDMKVTQAQMLVHKVLLESGLTMEWFG